MVEAINEVDFDKVCQDMDEEYISCDKTLVYEKEELSATLQLQENVNNIDRNSEDMDKFLDEITDQIRASIFKNCENSEHFICELCQGFMIDPITLPCGHTFMKSCINMDDNSSRWNCPRCKKSYCNNHISRLKPNVTISAFFEKVWSKEISSMNAYHEGNHLLLANKLKKAIEKFNKALELDPTNHLAVSGRSNALVLSRQVVTALKDTEETIRLRPRWALGYFQKAVALVDLKCYEEAAINFLLCYILDVNHLTDARSEAKKLMGRMVFPAEISSSPQNQAASHPFSFNTLARLKSSESQESIDSEDSIDSVGSETWCPLEKTEQDESMDWTNPILDHQAQFRKLIFQVAETIKKISTVNSSPQKDLEPGSADCSDFDCSICRRLLYQPVTTACGHTFCRTCLDRCFDHNPLCPLCKTAMENYLSEKREVTKLLDYVIQTLLPDEHARRQQIYFEEMEELANTGKDGEHVIPLFVCTVAYPNMPCPLHIFEPRYRLMIRQCVESGTNQFGMCSYVNSQNTTSIATVGTMLDITNVKYFADGRSIVNTSGGRRFRVLQYGMRDGYYTGAVEFFNDQIPEQGEIEDLQKQHDETRCNAVTWFTTLPLETRERILSHFGSMPSVEENYWTCADGPSWLWWMLAVLPIEASVQLKMLAVTSLSRRLEVLDKILLHIRSNSPSL